MERVTLDYDPTTGDPVWVLVKMPSGIEAYPVVRDESGLTVRNISPDHPARDDIERALEED